MKGKHFSEIVDLIVREDSRYQSGAYHLIRRALDYTLNNIQEKETNPHPRHITGAELSFGIRDYALEQYGPLALTLLNEWGIRETKDFGNIVFNLVEYEVFGKTEEDDPKDFNSVYSFDEAFKEPFQPNLNNCKSADQGFRVEAPKKLS